VPTRAAGRSFDAYLAAYLRELRARHLSISCEQRAQLVLPRFFAHLKEERVADLRRVTEAHLASFLRRLEAHTTKRGTPLALWSRIAFIDTLRHFFSVLESRRLLLANPARAIVAPRVDRLPRAVLSEREVERLVNTPSLSTARGRRDRAILELLYGTGIRIGECCRLDLPDLDLKEMTLLIRDGKGRKDRLVPVPKRAAMALDVYLREARPELARDPRQAALFLSKYRTRLSYGALKALAGAYAAEARIKTPTSAHVLRHTCATHLLRGGADVRHVQELLGHKWIGTTSLYTRVTVKDLAGVVERAHPRARRGRRKHRTG
jgi:integrase/recombinase XerD